MPRYYFHVRRGQITILDNEGIELADLVHAELKAAERAQEVVNEESLKRESLNRGNRGSIVVADDSWQTVFELPF